MTPDEHDGPAEPPAPEEQVDPVTLATEFSRIQPVEGAAPPRRTPEPAADPITPPPTPSPAARPPARAETAPHVPAPKPAKPAPNRPAERVPSAMRPPVPLTTAFEGALALASELHRDQFRKGTRIPYISHLLGVCAIVLEHGGTQDEAIGALLHDALEDQGDRIDADGIRTRCGAAVLAIVQGCTDGTGDRGPDTWAARKHAYAERIRIERNPSVLLVSAADKLHNARTIVSDIRSRGPAVLERFNGKREGTLRYNLAVVDAFEANPLAPAELVRDLRLEVEALVREAG